MKALRSFIVLMHSFIRLTASGIASQWYSPYGECYYASHSCIVLRTVMGRGEKHTPKAQGIKKEAVH